MATLTVFICLQALEQIIASACFAKLSVCEQKCGVASSAHAHSAWYYTSMPGQLLTELTGFATAVIWGSSHTTRLIGS